MPPATNRLGVTLRSLRYRLQKHALDTSDDAGEGEPPSDSLDVPGGAGTGRDSSVLRVPR